jgi:hypothetical protein
MLGIPTVVDRLIQQALQQVLSPLFDPHFSESSYGFRPQRSAHQLNYFRLAEVKGIFDELDSWIRRKLRNLIWRKWKRPFTRMKQLIQRGLPKVQALKSATNGRGPWWNAGAAHMHAAFPKSYFDRCGLLSLLEQRRRSQLAL